MNEQTFPCPACGGPVEPLPSAIRMACSYCSTQVTIPEALRQKASPPPKPVTSPAQASIPKPEKEPEEQIVDALRKAQPVAAKALNTFWLWSLIRRFAPGCLVALSIVCLLGCVGGFLFFSFIQNGG